jgi:adenylate cyclase
VALSAFILEIVRPDADPRPDPADREDPHDAGEAISGSEITDQAAAREYAGGPLDTQDGDRQAAARLAGLRRRALRVDTDPRWVAAARRLRSRLPGDANFGDPLSTAGRAPVEVIARGVTTLRSEPESLVKEVGLGALQLWQSVSEATGRGRGDREMALLFTDLVGFSSWALNVGDEAALALLRAVGVAVEAAIERRQGRLVKRLGDGVMATFLRAGDAAHAALDAQAAIAEVQIDGYQPRMRAGVHWGRPRKLGGDYLGVDVNIAARVAGAAKAEQVLVSEALLGRLSDDALRTTKPKRLRAQGAPSELRVASLSRA